ncbi:phosphodiesterase [Pandoraea terrae]|uniref:Phosphodiesterase n=1 Tax=Pandoraea terrae TaxID=1537710 RepID=A0A5E4SK96_9BURK|nr:phosphodiesterase [Pandoraea terrae]VVD74668.1 phosphodiesterase [Pandoraea terrae]
MLFCQITDLHIKRPGELACARVDTAAALRRAVSAINALRPRPQAVFATGDLVDDADILEYEYLRELLTPLEVPVFFLVGNHDDREKLRRAFPEHAYLRTGGPFVQYTLELGPLSIVALDTQDPPNGGGHLCDQRLAWLDEQLGRRSGRPTVVLMHHPPFDTGIGFMDELGLSAAGKRGLAEVLSRHAHVERVLCGHVHRSITACFAGTIASTCVSTAHQITLVLEPAAPESIMLEPPGYGVYLWHPDAGLRSHLAYTETYEGPLTFEGEPLR